MDAKELIKQCRYYHGEEFCPEQLKQFRAGESLWFYEMKWVEFHLQGDTDTLEWNNREYNAYGMSDFSQNDGVPLSLKALLFNRFYKEGYVKPGGAEFRHWYLQTYLQDLKV